MRNYVEYKDSLAFHPGYYIEEMIEESGLTQADFAKRLDTTPKNLSLLVRGKQSLSVDMAISAQAAGYGYLRDDFGLPSLPGMLDKQVVQVRVSGRHS